MDNIYDSPLNKAHYYSRQADCFAVKGLFDEACASHEEAACQLVQALKLTNNSLAQESIHLQRQYHLKKHQLLQLKKKHFLAIREAARVQKEVMSRVMKERKEITVADDASLQKAIYRTFDEADSLLELLVQKKESVNEKNVSETTQAMSTTAGTKKPKDDSVVIEELRIVNCQLRSLITQLMTELDNSEKQVAALQKRVAELEASGTSLPESLPHSEREQLLADLHPLETPHFEPT